MKDQLSHQNQDKRPSVIITGGSGLIGKYLTSSLVQNGYRVSHLSRKITTKGSPDNTLKVNVYYWNPGRRIADTEAFKDVDYVINLAGTNLGENRWTPKQKERIINSRVDSAQFLHEIISERGIPLKGFISASAVGYYGSVTTQKIFKEDDPPAHDFLGHTCRLWEKAADLFADSGIRTVKIRTSLVLAKENAAIRKLLLPAKYGLVIRTGDGHQYVPWIHITDLCNIFMKALEDTSMRGAYNAVSPEKVSHSEFVAAMAHALKRPVIFPPIPSFIIKAFLGEMSDIILKGSRISSEKIEAAGYKFIYENLQQAFKEVIVKTSQS